MPGRSRPDHRLRLRLDLGLRWLQPFAQNQPATVTINAVRALFEGGPVYHDLWQAAAWCAGIFVVFLAISLTLYRKAAA